MALSDDLRERVVGAVVEGGLSRNAAAKRFGVSIASALRWVARFYAKGENPPAPRGGDRRSGSAVLHALLGPSIAKHTTQKRTLQTAQRRDVRLIFRYNPRLESRDNRGSVADAIEETPRSRPATRIALEASHQNNTYYASVRKLRLVYSRVEVRRSRPSGDSKK